MKLRESEYEVKVPNIKQKAMELLITSKEFKASDGWYRKFITRNNFTLKNKYQAPYNIPE